MNRPLSIYLARPISGRTYHEISEWYNANVSKLRSFGYSVFHPLTGKNQMRPEMEFKAHGVKGKPIATNHAISERDRWMCSRIDVLLVDFTGSEHVSIGCCMELAMASYVGAHTIAVIPTGNVHQHAFILEAADIVFETLNEAMEYLQQLSEN